MNLLSSKSIPQWTTGEKPIAFVYREKHRIPPKKQYREQVLAAQTMSAKAIASLMHKQTWRALTSLTEINDGSWRNAWNPISYRSAERYAQPSMTRNMRTKNNPIGFPFFAISITYFGCRSCFLSLAFSWHFHGTNRARVFLFLLNTIKSAFWRINTKLASSMKEVKKDKKGDRHKILRLICSQLTLCLSPICPQFAH